MEDTSRINPLTKMAIDMLEDRFPELSEKYCPNKHERFCGITEGLCKLEECPKLKKKIKKG